MECFGTNKNKKKSTFFLPKLEQLFYTDLFLLSVKTVFIHLKKKCFLYIINQFAQTLACFFNGYFPVTQTCVSKSHSNVTRWPWAAKELLAVSSIHSLKDIGFKTFEKLFNSCVTVTHILDYSSSVWGYRSFQCIDKVQNRTLRYFIGVHLFAPTLSFYGDTGWIPSEYRKWGIILRFWNTLIKMDESILTKKVFDCDYNRSANNWSNDFKNIMAKLGLTNYYLTKSTVNQNYANTPIRQFYSNKWSTDIQTFLKLRTYRTFKLDCKCEDQV